MGVLGACRHLSQVALSPLGQGGHVLSPGHTAKERQTLQSSRGLRPAFLLLVGLAALISLLLADSSKLAVTVDLSGIRW